VHEITNDYDEFHLMMITWKGVVALFCKTCRD